MHTGISDNKFYAIPVKSKSGSNMDFYAANLGSNILGITLHFDSKGNPVYPWEKDWFYVDIKIDNKNKNRKSDMVQGTIAHEIGHGFGLAHRNTPYSIMAQSTIRKVQKVQKIDNDTLNSIYR